MSSANKNIHYGGGGGSRFDNTVSIDDNDGGNSNSSPDNNNNNIVVQHLRSQRDALQTQINNYEARLSNIREGMAASQTQVTYIKTDEIVNQQEKIKSLANELVEQQRLIEEYRHKFLETHDRTTKITKSDEVPSLLLLGPGHATKESTVLQEMDTLDDYLKYIDVREQSLWTKIDKLVNKIKRDSRIEAIKW